MPNPPLSEEEFNLENAAVASRNMPRDLGFGFELEFSTVISVLVSVGIGAGNVMDVRVPQNLVRVSRRRHDMTQLAERPAKNVLNVNLASIFSGGRRAGRRRASELPQTNV